jgi:hypothetical protein
MPWKDLEYLAFKTICGMQGQISSKSIKPRLSRTNQNDGIHIHTSTTFYNIDILDRMSTRQVMYV